jgi:hypothetical protein
VCDVSEVSDASSIFLKSNATFDFRHLYYHDHDEQGFLRSTFSLTSFLNTLDRAFQPSFLKVVDESDKFNS